MKFSSNVLGLGKLNGNVKKIQKIVGNPVAELKKIGILMQKSTIKTFETEGVNLLGHKWKDLKDSTKEARRRRGHYPGKILTVSGALKRAQTYELPTPRILRWGPDVTGWYGKYHQSDKPRKKIPRRQFLGTSKKDKDTITNILGKEIMKHISMEIRG